VTRKRLILGWFKPKGAMVEHNTELPAPAATDSLVWRKSTASGSSDSGGCLEVALMPDLVLVRDSKQATGPDLTFASSVWTAFVDTLR
jgi:Domain of unknown function (DUF397)